MGANRIPVWYVNRTTSSYFTVSVQLPTPDAGDAPRNPFMIILSQQTIKETVADDLIATLGVGDSITEQTVVVVAMVTAGMTSKRIISRNQFEHPRPQ